MGVHPRPAVVWEALRTCRVKFSEHLLKETNTVFPIFQPLNLFSLSDIIVTTEPAQRAAGASAAKGMNVDSEKAALTGGLARLSRHLVMMVRVWLLFENAAGMHELSGPIHQYSSV